MKILPENTFGGLAVPGPAGGAYAHPETSMPQAFNLQCNLTKFSTVIVGELSLQCFDTVDWVAGRASGL